ncbi:MAG: hypothetical protein KC549_18415, partial [Myxococcales bacterium]|nr:hypothetical protein [Myxococcales bacterium]
RTAAVTAVALAGADAARPGLEARLLRGLTRLVHQRLQPTGPAALVLPDFDATLGALRAIELPGTVTSFIARYKQVGDRGSFLWRWCWHGLQSTCLLPADAPWRAHTLAARLVAVILNVMLDDLADRPGTEVRFEQAIQRLDHPTPQSLRAPWDQLAPEARYDALITDLWHHVLGACTVLPRWERFRRLWHFDYQQVFNCMRYSMLTRELPSFDSLTENRAYVPHNMNMMVFSTMDFMAGDLPEESLGAVREAVWLGQSIGQLGNMIATWRREVPHRDFSSRIFTVARSRGIFTAAELATLPPAAIEARVDDAGLEADLLAELGSLRASLAGLAAEVRVADLSGFAAGIDTLIAMSLAARGLI